MTLNRQLLQWALVLAAALGLPWLMEDQATASAS